MVLEGISIQNSLRLVFLLTTKETKVHKSFIENIFDFFCSLLTLLWFKN
jgi:bacteriorhodopsin